MITGKQLLTGLLIAAFGSALSTVALAADDVDPIADYDEQPAYNNPAQAMHAAQLAEASALQPNEETQMAADDLAAAREAFDEANTAYQEALDDPTADIEAMETALDAATESLAEARGAYAEQVGALAGIRSEEIQAMRQSGMGWGLIAHELGVHPGVLGLGHGKRAGMDPADSPDDETVSTTGLTSPAAEIARATKRSAHAAANRGLGLTVRDKNTAQKGIGLARASEVSAAGVSSSTSQPGKGVAAGRTGNPGNSAAGRSAASGSQGIGVGLDAAGPGTSGIGSAGPGNSGNDSAGRGNSGRGDAGPGNSGNDSAGRGNSGRGDAGPGNSDKGGDGPGNSGRGNSGGGIGNGVGKK